MNDAALRIKTTLKARQMALLVALNDRESLRQAALDTHMSPPAASKMLKDIEDMFGVPFFERLPRGLKPTIYGLTMIAHVKMALANLERGQQSIEALKAGLSGQVRVGIIITAALTLIPQAILRTKKELPKLTIGVEVGTSKDLLASLRRDELDFLIARIPENENGSGLFYEDLSEEEECIVARNGHPLLSRADLTLKDLAQQRWILTSRVGILRNRIDAMFRTAGLECPSDVIEATSMSLILRLIQETDYLHVIPLALANYYVQTGSLAIVPFELPCKMANFGIITRRDIVLTPGANFVLNAIRTVASEIYQAVISPVTD